MSILAKKKWGRAWDRVLGEREEHNSRFGVDSRWGVDSRFAEAPWQRDQSRALRWAALGIVIGSLFALIMFAPAAWLAQAVNRATGERFMLAQAQGTVWRGDALVLLTGGRGSKDASVLPGRLKWRLGFHGISGLMIRLEHACCIQGNFGLLVRRTWSSTELRLMTDSAAGFGQWPNGWLSGLGTPWNTLELTGSTRLLAQDLSLKNAGQGWKLQGSLSAEMSGVASRLSPLPTLGSYRLLLQGDSSGQSLAQLQVHTIEGPLQLSGSGRIGPRGVQFSGMALPASESDQLALSNLLNIIGRRTGAGSAISIGTP
jgi:general secretion pathway protein N